MAEKAGGLLYFSRTIPGVANNKNKRPGFIINEAAGFEYGN